MATKVKAKKSPKKSTSTRPRRGRATSSRISSKNQITIPVEVLREVNLKPGDQVEFMIDKEERIVLAPSVEQEWKKTLRKLAGTMPGLGESFDYKKEREEWDRKATQTPMFASTVCPCSYSCCSSVRFCAACCLMWLRP